MNGGSIGGSCGLGSLPLNKPLNAEGIDGFIGQPTSYLGMKLGKSSGNDSVKRV